MRSLEFITQQPSVIRIAADPTLLERWRIISRYTIRGTQVPTPWALVLLEDGRRRRIYAAAIGTSLCFYVNIKKQTYQVPEEFLPETGSTVIQPCQPIFQQLNGTQEQNPDQLPHRSVARLAGHQPFRR
jgi:hypothetical protein